MQAIKITPDAVTGGLLLNAGEETDILLHPLWLRERVTDAQSYDSRSGQRLYDTAGLQPDIKIDNAGITPRQTLTVTFSDGHTSEMNLPEILRELGQTQDVNKMPVPKRWDASTGTRPSVDYDALDDPEALKSMLHDFLTYGYCIMEDTPAESDILLKLAGRFGFVRDTHWGQLFNEEKKPKASDIAYTDAALGAHTDNPYREPIPASNICIA